MNQQVSYYTFNHHNRLHSMSASKSGSIAIGLIVMVVTLVVVGGVVGFIVFDGNRRETVQTLRKQLCDLEQKNAELRKNRQFFENQFAQCKAEEFIADKASKIGLRVARAEERSKRMNIVHNDKNGWNLEREYLGMK